MHLGVKDGSWRYLEPFVALFLRLHHHTPRNASAQISDRNHKQAMKLWRYPGVLEGWWERRKRIKGEPVSKLSGERLTVSAPERRRRAVDGDRSRVERMRVPLRVPVRGGRHRTHGSCHRVSGVAGGQGGAPHRTSDTSQSQKPHP